MKIRAYLAVMAIAILVPIIIFSAVALNLLVEAQRDAALRGLHETARASALLIDRELSTAEAALRVLATSENLASGNLAGFYEQARSADRGSGAWTILIDRNGRQVINTLVPFGTELPPAVAGEHVEEVMSTGKTVVGSMRMGRVSGKSVTTVNVPVPLDNGQRYILTASFSAAHFRALLAQRQIPSQWVVALIDKEGKFISRSHRSEILVGQPARPELIAAARQYKEGMIRHATLEGIDSYDVFTHSSISGWTIAVAAPVALIDSSARPAVMVAVLGLLAALLCATGAALLFGRRLVKAVHSASVAAAALGRGEAPAPATSRVAEMDQLHRALNEAGTVLMQERQYRKQAEDQREELLVSEQAARWQAVEQNKAKDAFLAMLGHELRNPLSAISNAIAVLETPGGQLMPGRSVPQVLSIVRRQSQHLSRIVDDLLDLSRLMTGKIFLERQPLDMAEAVRRAVDALQTTERMTQRKVSVQLESAWVQADPTRLDQIINNLLINALKYTPVGAAIDIAVKGEEGQAVLTVHDSGDGIGPDLMPQIFEVFVQGSSTLDRTQGGLGIGLSLVRQLATLHGGTISADSAGIGQGSTFTVRLPLAKRDQEPGTATPPPAAASALATASGPDTWSILLIEDNDDSRMMMSTLLGLYGYRILEASSGFAGLALAAAECPDLAVVDIGLSDIDGYEIARRLRADPATRGISLIALTGYGQESDRRQALEAGFDRHMVKPVNLDNLIRTIGELAADAGSRVI